MAKKQEQSADRRQFLKLAGLGAAAGGVALVAGKETAEADTIGKPKDQLYSETEHVRTYYGLARF